MNHIVLVPPPHIVRAAIDFTQAHFAKGHMGYCIGSEGHLPHVTIAQIETDDVQSLKPLFDQLSKLQWDQRTILEFDDYYHSDGKPYNGVGLKPHASLRGLHDAVVASCLDHGVMLKNTCGDAYWPHLTFSKNDTRLPEPVMLPKDLTGQSSGWVYEIGYMGSHGVYLGRNPK